MCTVTYLPSSEGYILTSNRDEDPRRASSQLDCRILAGQKLLYPIDTGAGGTWIAGSNADRAICVLNGAHRPYKRRPPYRRSRGMMALDYFCFEGAEAFFREYTFRNMEPFTLIIIENHSLWDLRWDGEKTYLLPLEADEPFIWSSASLYTAEASERRARWFYEWLTQHDRPFTPSDILDLHRSGGVGDRNIDFVMDRGAHLRTLSMTQIVRTNGHLTLNHTPILESTNQSHVSMQLKKM